MGRAKPATPCRLDELTVSVIVPCKNERDNVLPAVARLPKLAGRTEIIFCDDRSTDGTADQVRLAQSQPGPHEVRLVDGPGVCKSRNVWTGFEAATGDILIIMDGDLTVIPEELPAFIEALAAGRGQFANGTRLVHRMEQGAMSGSRYWGNRAFAVLMSWVIRQRVTDTLCGTKAFWAADWPQIKSWIGTWGADDRWGDFEMLFGAARLGLKIVNVPVHYAARTYGESKMTHVWGTGLTFLQLCWGARRKLRSNEPS